jgi:hypothetical protein
MTHLQPGDATPAAGIPDLPGASAPPAGDSVAPAGDSVAPAGAPVPPTGASAPPVGAPAPAEGPHADGSTAVTRPDNGSDPSTVDAPARWSGAAAVPPPAPRKPWWRRSARPEEPEDDRLATPAVDPWADQDTPWDAFPIVPEAPATPMPPTRIDAPAPTRVEPPATPAATHAPQPSGTHAVQPPAAYAPQPPTFTNRPPIAAQPRSAAAPHVPPPPARPAQAQPAQAQPAQTRPGTQPPLPPAPKSARQLRRERKAQSRANRQPVAARPPAGPTAGGPAGGPLPAPPPWAPRQAARPLPPPPRRKRRWGRRLALVSLLGVACCCGAPFGWYRMSAARQYPVTAALPSAVGDLHLRDTEDTGANGFAGEYGDSRGKRVTVFGVTGFRLTPGTDVDAQLQDVADEYGISEVRSFDMNESGAHESCGVGREGGASVVVCAWADHGSMATVLLTRRSVEDSAALVARLREAVLTKGRPS